MSSTDEGNQIGNQTEKNHNITQLLITLTQLDDDNKQDKLNNYDLTLKHQRTIDTAKKRLRENSPVLISK